MSAGLVMTVLQEIYGSAAGVCRSGDKINKWFWIIIAVIKEIAPATAKNGSSFAAAELRQDSYINGIHCRNKPTFIRLYPSPDQEIYSIFVPGNNHPPVKK
jgi:ABC-type cobalt transport system substrate-binding protein